MVSKAFEPPLTISEVEVAFERCTAQQCRISRGIKEGGQGSVFDATIGNTRVALKVYAADYVEHRAQREVDAMKRLTSPLVAKLYGDGFLEIRNERCFYSASVFIEGEDLEEKLRKETLTIEQTEDLLRDVCSVIDEMWAHRIVHCDITPKNIMLTTNGHFVLIDLGIAKHLNAGVTSKINCIWGTPGYLAPEQLNGRQHLTLRVDIFALGLVAYKAITGRPPYNRQPNIGSAKPPPLSRFIAGAGHLDKIIEQMLNPNPIRRPRSGAEIIRMLGGNP